MIGDFLLEIDAADGLGLRANPRFEPEVLNALERFVKPGMTVVDAGAHIGYFTLHLSKLVGKDGRVHAFEPDRANFHHLRRNLELNHCANVSVHPLALGAHDGEGWLYRNDYSSGMHRLYDSLCCGASTSAVTIQRLDARFVPGEVGLIKLDVEGFEPFVVEGAGSLLRDKDLIIVSEYCPPSMLEADASIPEFLARMRQESYSVEDAQGFGVCWEDLGSDALKWQQLGRGALRAACAKKSNPEIAQTVATIAAELHCARPYFENLVFLPSKHSS